MPGPGKAIIAALVINHVLLVVGSHREVVRDAKLAQTLANLVRQKQERWSPHQVEKAKKELFGK